jgi:UMP-CMP kinase
MYHYWDQMIGDNVNVVGCLYLQCSEKILLERLHNRAKVSNREDDKNPELAKIRLRTFNDNTLPAVQLYANHGLLYIVDAEKSIDEVYISCKNAVSEMLVKNKI